MAHGRRSPSTFHNAQGQKVEEAPRDERREVELLGEDDLLRMVLDKEDTQVAVDDIFMSEAGTGDGWGRTPQQQLMRRDMMRRDEEKRRREAEEVRVSPHRAGRLCG